MLFCMTEERLKTIDSIYQAEITEKKSRFIATLAPVSTAEEAADFVRDIRKQHWNAKHHCSAWIIGADQAILHSSDDGEPAGTAGKPILSVLSGHRLFDVVAVVTRYFGGVLLGTGGLVRAYSGAVEECIAGAVLKEMTPAAQMQLTASYNDVGRLQYMIAQNGLSVLSSDYTDKVVFQLLVPEETEEGFSKAVREATGNSAVLEVLNRGLFPL